jgi:serine/threonine protein kinase
LLQKI